MKVLLQCSLLASLAATAAAAAFNSSQTPSAPAVIKPNNGRTPGTKLAIEQWPPAPWIIPIEGPLALFIHAYGSRSPPYITQDAILNALRMFMDRILSRGQPTDYYPPTVLGYEGVHLFLIRSREQEALLLTRYQAASVVQNLFVRTRDAGGMEITDAEIMDDGIVVRSLALRFYRDSLGGMEVG